MKTKVFFVSDVHGSDRCFRKFINAGKFYGADVLILGGDVTGKTIVPMVRMADGTIRVREGKHGPFVEVPIRGRGEQEELQRCR